MKAVTCCSLWKSGQPFMCRLGFLLGFCSVFSIRHLPSFSNLPETLCKWHWYGGRYTWRRAWFIRSTERQLRRNGRHVQKERSSRNVPAASRFLLLVFIVCLRGAQPCTINPVSDRQTLLCLLFCCWLPPGRPCALLLHMLPSSPRTRRNGADVSSVAQLGRSCLKWLLLFRTNFF